MLVIGLMIEMVFKKTGLSYGYEEGWCYRMVRKIVRKRLSVKDIVKFTLLKYN